MEETFYKVARSLKEINSILRIGCRGKIDVKKHTRLHIQCVKNSIERGLAMN